jgi:DMSO/TMAO reductase YedYZ molybdopterin-dependent catalytic subunit
LEITVTRAQPEPDSPEEEPLEPEFRQQKLKRSAMEKRRQFLKFLVAGAAWVGTGLGSFFSTAQWVLAETKKIILPKGTPQESLIDKNPADLDARNLEVTPLEKFGTMGLSDYAVNLEKWGLEVEGRVKKPLRLTYEELKRLPSVERKILMICPGFFANYGAWKGVSLHTLLKLAQAEDEVTHVTVRGPEGKYESTQRYPLKDILSNTAFLAYEVNGKPLPQRDGFPLRAVAEGYYGHDWVKYVYKVTAERI